MKYFTAVILGVLPGLIFAQNLISNGSFEFGTDGFVLKNVLRTDQNPQSEFIPLKAVADQEADGKLVLCLDNHYGNFFDILSREFSLKSDTEYTLRYRAKSTHEGQELSLTVYSASNGWRSWSSAAVLGNGWKDYESKFKTGPADGAPFLYQLQIRNSSPTDIPGSTVYLDKLELFETKSAPAGGLELAVSVPEKLFISENGKNTAEVTLKAGNFSEQPWSGEITLTLSDDYLTDIKSEQKIKIELAPGEIREFPVAFETGFGAFEINAAAPGMLHMIPGFYAVIGKYEQKPLDFDRDFCIAVNDGPHFMETGEYPLKGFLVYNASVGLKFDYLAKMGCRMIREHDGGCDSTDWSLMEPEQGKWDFSHADRILGIFRQYGIEPVSCVGRIYFLRPTEREKWWRNKGWPDWIWPTAVKGIHADYNWIDIRGRVYLPRMEYWREYIRKMAEHTKGNIKYYEIFNEPNGVMAAESYFPYMKAAYEEIKKVNPAAKIIGLCVTTDFGATGDRFVLDVMKLGGANYMDIAAFHPYQGRELSSLVPADRYIANFRKTVGNDLPVWNTEIYYLFDTSADLKEHGLINPAHAAARFLTDLGENVGQSLSIHGKQLWNKKSVYSQFPEAQDLVPNGVFVAYNALARHFEAAKCVGKFKLQSGNIVYLFRKDEKLAAAVWNWEKKDGVKGDFSGLEVLDVYGNPVKAGVLPLTGAPYYVFPGNLNEAEFRTKLENLPVSIDNPVGASPVVRIVGEEFALANLYNDSAVEQSAIAGFSGDGFTTTASVRVTIPANGSADVQIPLRRTNTQTPPVLRIFNSKRMQVIPVRVQKNLLTDPTGKVTLGDDDFQAEWILKRENDIVVFEATVKDSTRFADASKHPWEQDSLELFFDFAPERMEGLHPDMYTTLSGVLNDPRTFRAFIIPHGEKQLLLWLPLQNTFKESDFNYQATPLADGYKIRFTVANAKPDKLVGFDVKFNNVDPAKKSVKELRWTNNKNNIKDRTVFGIVKF